MIPKIQHSKDKPPAGVGGVLATQCPLIGGSAVYLARPIVELFDESITYNDVAVCLSQGVSMKVLHQAIVSENLSAIKVYPNPAKDEINFEFGVNRFTKLIIYDSFGKVAAVEFLQNKQMLSLPTTIMANGIYRYVFKGASEELSGKIVILK